MKKTKRGRNGRNGNGFSRMAVHGVHDACIDAIYEETNRALEADPKLRAKIRKLSREILELLVRDLSD